MEKVSLSQEKETLLITLYAKGQESHLPDSLLQDRFAASAIDRIDYDFSRLGINRDMMIGLAMRAYILDNWARAFLAFHPDAIVLHLGCGLDSRVFRIDPPTSVHWFDIDYPDVIALRRRLYPERDGYSLIGSSVTDPAWLETIVPEGRPALILAEGMFPYLQADQAVPLLDRLSGHFRSGEIAFDAYNSLGLRMIRKQPSIRATGAQLHWSLGDPHDIERQIPRLRLMQELLAYDRQGYDPAQIARMSRPARLAVWLFKAIPVLGRVGRLLRYRF
ncbi:class I SAM-dependent methyltransferase [Labrys sp. KB_33_2]|uniref:class I SAM-dependent methyltransferase n=1 Tax=Labrys sp. KB_33_2 TaxID=3237479 RepID=UPI003F903B06